MPKYVIEREVPGAGNLTYGQLKEISQKSVAVLSDMGPKIEWIHSYVTGDKVYCVYLAPDEAAIFLHAKRVGASGKGSTPRFVGLSTHLQLSERVPTPK